MEATMISLPQSCVRTGAAVLLISTERPVYLALLLFAGAIVPVVSMSAPLDTLSGLFAFLVSFWVIASYWIAHHRIFNRIGAHDGTLLTINFAFLMWVVLVPFSTSMVMEYGESQLIWDVYVCHLLLTGLTLLWLWRYASRDERLIGPDADLDTPRRFGIQIWIISAVFLLSIVISFFSVDIAQWFLLLLYLLTLEGPLRRRLAGRIRGDLREGEDLQLDKTRRPNGGI
jgi:uncharacterized membrane protein